MQGEIKRTFRFKINPGHFPSGLFLAQSASTSLPPRNHLTLRIGLTEKDLMAAAKVAKGRWNPDMKLWVIRHGNIRGTALAKHLILYTYL